MDVIEARRRILLNAPHIVTPTPAGLVNFSTDMKAPLKECRVHFAPVQEGTGDPSPTNVRPISGWTGCEVHRTGKNLFNVATLITRGQYVSSGAYQEISSRIMTDYIPIKEGMTYTIQVDLGNNESIALINYNLFNENKEWLGDRVKNGESVSFSGQKVHTFSAGLSGTRYVRIVCRDANDSGRSISTKTLDNAALQLELGSTATPYEPYQGTTLPIDWSSAGTVYGGYVDLVTGEVWETWGGVTLDGSQSAYISGSGYRGTNCTDVWFDAGLNNWGYNTSYAQIALTDSYSDALMLTQKAVWGNPDLYPWAYVLNSYNQIHCVFDNSTVGVTSEDTNAQAITKIKSWLASHPIIVKYRLSDSKATLLTTLTPTALRTLIGTNNIWSNANGNVDLSYWTH